MNNRYFEKIFGKNVEKYFEESSRCIYTKLITNHRIVYPSDNFDLYFRSISSNLTNGVTNCDDIVDDTFSEIRQSRDAFPAILRLGCIYYILAQAARDYGKTELAWYSLNRSCGYAEKIEVAASYSNHKDVIERLKESAKKGGENRGKEFDYIRDEIVSILKSPPPEGWGRSLETRKIIKDKLDVLLSTKSKSLIPKNLENALRRWFAECKEIADAYLANRSEDIFDE